MGCCGSRTTTAAAAAVLSVPPEVPTQQLPDETKLDLSSLKETKIFASPRTTQLPLTGQQSLIESESSFRAHIDAHKTTVLIACHPVDIAKGRQIQTAVASVFPPPQSVLIDNSGELDYREALVTWADIFVAIISYSCQSDGVCRELISYAAQLQKPILAVLTEEHFDPSGDLAVACKAAGKCCRWRGPEGRVAKEFVTDAIMTHLNTLRPTSKVPRAPESTTLDVHPIHSASAEGVFICSTAKGKFTADLIAKGQGVQHRMSDMRIVRSDSIRSNGLDEVYSCSVFILVLSDDLQLAEVNRKQFELARRLKKEIIVVKSPTIIPHKWLALAIAGRTIFNLSTEQDAYSHFQLGTIDTYVMNELIISTFEAAKSHNSSSESIKLLALISEYKKRLPQWPPDKSFVENPSRIPIPSRNDLLPTASNQLPTEIRPTTGQMVITASGSATQHHIQQLMATVAKDPSYRDCLLVGDWQSQPVITAVSEALRSVLISHFVLLWGGPIELNLDSMAKCVENSTAVLVFLSDKFQQSQFGRLTLKYSLALGKPMIFILNDPNMKLKLKINTAQSALVAQSLTIELSNPADLQSPMMGFPRIQLLSTALLKLRWWANQQPKLLRRDVSAVDYKLQGQLENCRCALARLDPDSVTF